MKPKVKSSQLDYFFFLLEEYRDKLTLVIALNLLALFLGSKLNDFFKTVYLESRFTDFVGFLSHQSELINFYEALFYCYLIGMIFQLAASKFNLALIYTYNGWFIFISTTYFWSNITFESIFNLIKLVNYIFYFVLLFQILFYIVFFNEIFKIRLNQRKINHS